MDLSLFLGVLKEGLKLLNQKEANKYLDRVIKLEKEYYAELAKSEDDRSQLFLDERLHELAIIGKAFTEFKPSKE